MFLNVPAYTDMLCTHGCLHLDVYMYMLWSGLQLLLLLHSIHIWERFTASVAAYVFFLISCLMIAAFHDPCKFLA